MRFIPVELKHIITRTFGCTNGKMHVDSFSDEIGRFGTDMILRVKTELMNPIPMSGLVGDKREFIGTLLELQRLRHHGGCLEYGVIGWSNRGRQARMEVS